MRLSKNLRRFSLLLVVCLATAAILWPSKARAQWRRGYPYAHDGSWVGSESDASIRVEVTPKDAQVYVDGYYAGLVDDFDGFFQRLHVPPGEHEVVLLFAGYRTVHQRVDLSPRSTYRLRYTMEKLAAGETAEPAPVPPPEPPAPTFLPAGGRPPGPRGMPPRPPREAPVRADGFGTLAVRVQPADADVWIDGEVWRGSDGGEHLTVQVSEGTHRVEVRRDGYRRFSADIEVRQGETSPLNVSLSREP